MSVRERFFRKVQQNQNPPAPAGGSVGADIRAFCQRMDELAQQVSEWFEGSGVEVIITTISLSDLSTIGRSLNSGASRYEITNIRLQNGLRSVSITPEQLYRDNMRGCVTLTIEAPDRHPARQRFHLRMAPEGGWFILGEHQTATAERMMTEDVFFRTIENLA